MTQSPPPPDNTKGTVVTTGTATSGRGEAAGGVVPPAVTTCPHCRNGWFRGTEVECVNGVLIDIDVAHEGWQRDVDYPAAPCVSKSGKWPKRDRGCQARLEEWAARGGEPQEDAP